MKHLVIAAAVALLAGPVLAEPVLGTWKTQPGDDGNFGHVEIAPCGPSICGTIVAAFNGAGAPVPSDNIGRQMIWDMTAQGSGSYRGGKIWAPDRDQTYNSRMQLSGDALEVQGCVLGICRGQNWSRVN